MSRAKKSVPAPWMRKLAALVFLWAGSGCFETQTAGTSTTTGNTISAFAKLSDGSPAAGAKVSLRESGSLPLGVPGNRAGAFAKDTVADASGFFRIPVPSGSGYFLSIYSGGTGNEGYWRDNTTPSTVLAKRAGPNDTVWLQKTAALSGHVVMSSGDSIWLCFPGTSHFARPQGDGSFILDSLPPGSHDLRVIRSGPGGSQSFYVDGWTVLSGARMILDTLVLPVDTSVHALSLPACRDTVDTMVFAAASGNSRPDRLFRSAMLSSPPEWVELDACLGIWTRKGALPNSVSGNIDLFAGPWADYLVLSDSNRILKLDAGGAQILPTFPANLSSAYSHAGRFYAFFHLDSALQSFPDEASWLLDAPDRNFPRPAIFQRFAVGDSAIHYLITDSAGISLQRYNFNPGSFHAPVSVPGFSGACAGMASDSKDDVWILNDGRELVQADDLTGQTRIRIKIAVPDSLRGLAGEN